MQRPAAPHGGVQGGSRPNVRRVSRVNVVSYRGVHLAANFVMISGVEGSGVDGCVQGFQGAHADCIFLSVRDLIRRCVCVRVREGERESVCMCVRESARTHTCARVSENPCVWFLRERDLLVSAIHAIRLPTQASDSEAPVGCLLHPPFLPRCRSCSHRLEGDTPALFPFAISPSSQEVVDMVQEAAEEACMQALVKHTIRSKQAPSSSSAHLAAGAADPRPGSRQIPVLKFVVEGFPQTVSGGATTRRRRRRSRRRRRWWWWLWWWWWWQRWRRVRWRT